MAAAMLAAVVLFSAGFGIMLETHRIVWFTVSLAGFYGFVAIAMVLFSLARWLKGMLDPVRRVTVDNARLFWHYTVAQTLVGLLLVHGSVCG